MMLHYFTKKRRKVRTIVVYSSDIIEVEDCIDAGTIKYNIEPFYMKKKWMVMKSMNF